MPPSRLLLSCLSGTAFSHLLGVLAMSAADHKRRQLVLPHSRADELKPSPGPAEQHRLQRIEREGSPEAMFDPSAMLQARRCGLCALCHDVCLQFPPPHPPPPTHPIQPSLFCPWCRQVPQLASSPSWLLGLLLLVHAAPLLAIAMACGLLEAPAISRLFEIETHGANRTEV